MKNTFKIFATLFLLVFAINEGMAQMPTFTLIANNCRTSPGPNGEDSLFMFDIRCIWTNSGASDNFRFAAGQYFLNYNTASGANGLRRIGSDLIAALCPPTYAVAAGRLNMSTNLPVPGQFHVISNAAPGTLMLSVEVRTNQHIWPLVPSGVVWRTSATPFTKLSYFDPNDMLVEIPNTGGTFQSDCETFILPVELASFTSVVKRNDVTLNWSTSSETNNAGFDVERKAGNSEWTTLGRVNGAGTTTETKNYTFNDRPGSGTFSYRLKQIDFNGNSEYFNLTSDVIVGVPSTYAISQNYPNPFNPSTKIDFDLPYDGKVNIVLFDISGREVGTLVNDVKTAGYYTISFNASNLSSGMYFYRISATGGSQNFVTTKKMVLIK
jgi:hypothetical protein